MGLFGLILLTGFWALDCSVIHEYHFVNLLLTWDEAKAYCRSSYSDLASVHSDEEQKLLYQVAGTPISKGWIGLHHTRNNWSWTLEDNHLYSYEDGTFEKWVDPPPGTYKQCGSFIIDQWSQMNCSEALNFVCQNADFKYFLIERMMDWNKALEYCRINYTDLANIRSETDKSDLANLVDGQRVWIGLHNRWRWSDSLVFNNCSLQQPFYCHKVLKQTRRLMVKIRIGMSSPYGLEDSTNLHQVILKQIHQELSKQAPQQNFTLMWKKELTEE
ncbi:secretory phospholipase A2 receptor-like isoform X2 [Clupea harengus]|uniref:Secretory phospholipase A2 receptor-like isoform X2 n=1 Tax=Clupea harengus TaxID=7950 RepID=A0A6P8GMR7_CLUHA|nr:secretory phospholipase A2 receptor-like isoform X2 [Clupea harengus]